MAFGYTTAKWALIRGEEGPSRCIKGELLTSLSLQSKKVKSCTAASNTTLCFLRSCWHFAHLCTGSEKWSGPIDSLLALLLLFFFGFCHSSAGSKGKLECWKKVFSTGTSIHAIRTFCLALCFSLVSFSHSCSCLLTAASSALQHTTGINTICTPEKRFSFWFLPNLNNVTVETSSFVWKWVFASSKDKQETFSDVLNCTKIAFSRCHICYLRLSFFYRITTIYDNKTRMEKSSFWTFLVLCTILSPCWMPN